MDPDDLGDRLGWTALHRAAALARRAHTLTNILLEAEHSRINTRDTLGRMPLHWLAENGEAEVIRMLTNSAWKVDVHARDITGFTALHCACWADDRETAAALLDAGSDVNALDKHGRTPLMHFDNPKLLDLMIAREADLYIQDDEGANIMHHVSVGNQYALARTLLEDYGHGLFVPNHAGDMPLGLAVQNNSLDVLSVMLPYLETFPVSVSSPLSRGILWTALVFRSRCINL
jgi:ankyrin repeat protein